MNITIGQRDWRSWCHCCHVMFLSRLLQVRDWRQFNIQFCPTPSTYWRLESNRKNVHRQISNMHHKSGHSLHNYKTVIPGSEFDGIQHRHSLLSLPANDHPQGQCRSLIKPGREGGGGKDWIDWMDGVYAVSAIFQPCNGGGGKEAQGKEAQFLCIIHQR